MKTFHEWLNESPLAHFGVRTSSLHNASRIKTLEDKTSKASVNQRYVSGHFSAADEAILSHPRTLRTLEQKLSKTGYKFNIIMMERDGGAKRSAPDEMYREKVEKYMEENGIKKEGHITFVKNSSSGDYLTPWMILHTLGHALTEADDKLTSGVLRCLSGSGIGSIEATGAPLDFSDAAKISDLLVFKSVREPELYNPIRIGEVIHDLVAEFLWHGRIRTKEENQRPIAQCLEGFVNLALNNSVGRIIYDWSV